MTLLNALEGSPTNQHRVHRLQTLLFLIHRHWRQLGRHIGALSKSLLASLVVSDEVVQAWTLMCIAAIASESAKASHLSSAVHTSSPIFGSSSASKSPSPHSPSLLDVEWPQLWAYAIRKMTVPATCRAAAHAAHVVLTCRLVPDLIMLADIEHLFRDIEVQGPSFPYDSVCDFLSVSLQLISHDVRLFRMELEEKVLGWLVTFWNVLDGTTRGLNARSRLENHSPNDLLRLLTSICRLDKRALLLQHDLLPDAPIVSHSEAQAESSVLRDWVLHARLQLPRTAPATMNPTLPPTLLHDDDASADQELQSSSGRSRKVSAFLLKSVESLRNFWDASDADASVVTVEKARRSIDLAVLAVCFEATLQLNGITQNRRTIKDASYLLSAVLPSLSSARFSISDMAVIVQGFEPLVELTNPCFGQRGQKSALLAPGAAAGIRKELVPTMDDSQTAIRQTQESLRGALQKIIWQSSDVSFHS